MNPEGCWQIGGKKEEHTVTNRAQGDKEDEKA